MTNGGQKGHGQPRPQPPKDEEKPKVASQSSKRTKVK